MNIRNKKSISALAMLLSVVASTYGVAIWDGGGTDDDWFTAENWDTDEVPLAANYATIDSGTASLSSGDAVANRVYVGSVAGQTGVLNVSAGSLTGIVRSYVGRQGTGTINQSGGSLDFGYTMFVGSETAGSVGQGTYNLSGGTLDLSHWNNDPDSLVIGEDSSGTFNVSGGTLLTDARLLVRNSGSFNVLGNDATISLGGTAGATAASWRQLSGAELGVSVDTDGLSTIFIENNGTAAAQFDSGAILDVDYLGAGVLGTWTVMELEGGEITDNGLVLADTVDTDIWSFAVDNSGANGVLTVTAIPEPATLGLIALFGGGILFIRRRFMI